MQDNPAQPSTRVSLEDLNASSRFPVLTMLLGGAAWLVLSSLLGLLASLKFHQPSFLANFAWLTYGRVRPAQTDAFLYGFALQSGLAVILWLLSRLGGARMAQPWVVFFGAKIWNLGVFVGTVGILTGDSTGYETFEFPRYAAPFLLIGYALIGLPGLMTFHRRAPGEVYPTAWFFVAALFWFPWIFTSAALLILVHPAPGIVQALVAWWYAANLQGVWLGIVGLGLVFYLIPLLSRREFQSRSLALLIFWLMILFCGWTGVPSGAPLPASWPALSAAAGITSLVTLLAVACSLGKTFGGKYTELKNSTPLRFGTFGAAAFLIAGLMGCIVAIPAVGRLIGLTWFTPARLLLSSYGFFAMVLFAAAYHIVPQLIQTPGSADLGRAHFVAAVAGVVLVSGPLAVGGLLQGLKLANPTLTFQESSNVTLSFLRLSTLGELLLLIGNVLFLGTLARLGWAVARNEACKAISSVTTNLKPAGAGA
jgi:cytochrome c oxidase cbb3-type subunit 1